MCTQLRLGYMKCAAIQSLEHIFSDSKSLSVYMCLPMHLAVAVFTDFFKFSIHIPFKIDWAGSLAKKNVKKGFTIFDKSVVILPIFR